jgi:hypothetical protein
MQRTELHFIIDSEGNIQSVVKGVKGNGCKILIEDIKKLGQTVHESSTGEFYEKEQNQSRILGRTLLLTNLPDYHNLQILSVGGIDRPPAFPLVRR